MEIEVVNAGMPGDTTVEVLRRFDRDVAARNPDWCALLIGLNDMLYPGHRLTPGEYGTNLTRLFRRLAATGCRVVAGTLPPVDPARFLEQYPIPDDPLAAIAAGNRVLEEIAGDLDVALWEVRAVIAADPGTMLLPDGMHWTAAACDAAARSLAELLAPQLKGGETILCLGDSLTYGVYLKGRGSARSDAETYPGRLAFLLRQR